MNNGKIYTLSHPITNEIVYIGQTSQCLKNRLRGHITDSKRSIRKLSRWFNKLEKQGLTPIIEELDSCDLSNLDDCEIYWISQFKSWGFLLKNHTAGGKSTRGHKSSDLTKQKQSESLKGEKNPFYGKFHTKESKQKISDSNKGKHRTDDFKKRRSVYMKANPISNETRNKIAESNKLKIEQYDMSMNFIKIYDSAADACRELNTSSSKICMCCKNLRKSHKGFIWKYHNAK